MWQWCLLRALVVLWLDFALDFALLGLSWGPEESSVSLSAFVSLITATKRCQAFTSWDVYFRSFMILSACVQSLLNPHSKAARCFFTLRLRLSSRRLPCSTPLPLPPPPVRPTKTAQEGRLARQRTTGNRGQRSLHGLVVVREPTSSPPFPLLAAATQASLSHHHN